MGRHPIAALVAAAALSAALSACGSNDDGGPPAPAPVVGQEAGAGGSPSGAAGGEVLSGTLPLLNGRPQDLAQFRGKVVLVVNTASECGFTPQFGALERLYRERRDEGLMVLGFPADDVASQEPRTDEQIGEFCEENFGVSFPMFAKSNVVDEPVNPLFERLAAEAGAPTWNFNKYLLDRKGEVVERYDAATAPDDPALAGRIDDLL